MPGFLGACDWYARHLMKPSDQTRLLQPIAAISSMQRGQLSTYTFKERSATAGPCLDSKYGGRISALPPVSTNRT